MRTIIKDTTESDVVTLSNFVASTSRYYGIDPALEGEDANHYCSARGFIIQSGYQSGKYRMVSCNGLTYANGWNESDSLDELIRYAVNCGFKVVEFNTHEALLKWLIED